MNKDTVQAINNIWFKCPDTLSDSRRVCPTHGYRHKALPDDETLKKIIELKIEGKYKFNLVELSKLWKVNLSNLRAEIRRLYGVNNNIFSNSYNWDNIECLVNMIEIVESNRNIKSAYSLQREVNFNRSKWKSFINHYKNEPLFKLLLIKIEENKSIPPKNIKCYRCYKEKSIDNFYNDSNRRDGYSRTCKECSMALQKKHYYLRYEQNKEGKVFVKEKFCTYCKQTLSADKFHKQLGNTTGLQQYCKDCQPILRAKSIRNSYRNVRNNV